MYPLALRTRCSSPGPGQAFVISAAVLATQTNAINGATANLETTTTGEKLNIADALPTEQELTALTDDRSN